MHKNESSARRQSSQDIIWTYTVPTKGSEVPGLQHCTSATAPNVYLYMQLHPATVKCVRLEFDI